MFDIILGFIIFIFDKDFWNIFNGKMIILILWLNMCLYFVVDCGNFLFILRMIIKGLEGGIFEGVIIMYYCDENIDLFGNLISVCIKEGVWLLVIIKCICKF